MLLVILGAGAYVGWNIGANDTANCVGTSVGCGLISFRNAVILVSIFALLGALLQGQHVMQTIGKGIVKADLGYQAVVIALISSGFFVTLATFFRIPTSTSQAIVGGVVGIGLALRADVNYQKLTTIAESWIICPVLVMVLAFVLMHVVNFILKKFESRSLLMQHTMGRLAILSACYVAYSMGANNAGNAVGPIANLGIFHPKLLLFIGGLSIAIGAATYGKKVAHTVGTGITPLDIPAAFIAQISAAFGMHLFSMLGIPVSTSSAIVGAVVGVGLVKGFKAISTRMVFTILIGWLLTPALAAAAAYIFFKLIRALWG
ncbi:MAG: inorganic phosphate transporter family protein [Deltaproteobacteria bacterium]|nr:inorganic phosphate transporter family protein [Deltaproteobacteria bacterium]